MLPIEKVTLREKPLPRTDQEETGLKEDWITATADDFFIDEIDRSSDIPGPLKGVFGSLLGDLYTLRFWQELTDRLRKGEVRELFPHDRRKKFRNVGRGGLRTY